MKKEYYKKIWQMNLNKNSKAIFLDRDGVINIDKQYVCKIEDFEFIDGIFDLLRYLQKLGYILIIVTNQSGIGRGYYTQEDFDLLTSWMLERLQKESIDIKKVFHCSCAPEDLCQCRKPNPKMLLDAQKEFSLNLSSSWMIGDKKTDIDAGKNAKVGKTIFVSRSDCGDFQGADFCVTDIKDIAKIITI